MSAELKTVREVVGKTADYLAERNIDSPRLSAELLLGDVLSVSRIELYFHFDRPLTPAELDIYRQLVRRRGQGEPLQTLIGTTEFYSRTFKVESGVFIPRPETERLVEHCVELLTPDDRRLIAPVAVEIGCGTGIIGVTLACEIPSLVVHAVDGNPAAVALTTANARRHGVEARVTARQGRFFESVPSSLEGHVDLFVSNPPYIPTADIEALAVEVRDHDPREALDGGADGLDFYRALAGLLPRWLAPDGLVALEIGYDQGETVPALLAGIGCRDISLHQDYNDQPRVVTGRWPSSDDEDQHG